jgi:UDP-glucose 4-epimerase
MSKILITGATGFIGGYLVKHFIKEDDQIIAQGSSKSSINNLKKELLKSEINLNNIDFWQQNFLNKKWNFPKFSEIDYIIHCAAVTKVREGTIENYDKYFGMNVITTKRIAKKALDEEISHFIHLSTGQVYGHQISFPITENSPKNPINLYGITKLIGENVITSLGLLGLNFTIARPFSVYGKGHYNIISIIKNKIMNDNVLTIFGDGTQSRAFMHVKDICGAIGFMLNNKNSFSEDYNLSGPKEYSVNDLVRMISEKLSKKPKITYKEANVNEIKRNIADLSKIKKLGYTPHESLEDFIKRM